MPRHAAAKYLARIALALPSETASEICDVVLVALEDALEQQATRSGEAGIHGSCLAIGEMARRKVLPHLTPSRTDKVVARIVHNSLKESLECFPRSISMLTLFPAAEQALRVDHQSALRAVGTSVRDAASYVLWALARSLPASSLADEQVRQIAAGLLCTACLDRDVSVRRAASAAWQEAVGRWVSTALLGDPCTVP